MNQSRIFVRPRKGEPEKMRFDIQATDPGSSARAGILHTDHGPVETPVFMTVGTAGTVKGIHPRELAEIVRARIMLSNTYHLYLRPGLELLERAGGLHRFCGWSGPMLTDSGGYQVYSLADARKIDPDGVRFKSHIDGSTHHFSPERAIDIQRVIGADIVMAFDECTPYPCTYDYARSSMELTHDWLQRCIRRFGETECPHGYGQSLFPIVQGSTFADLRVQSAEYIAALGCDGNAIGGLSVGEPAADMYAMTALCCGILPADKPRYLMGVGTPENLLECMALGIDMFDCVLPTRNGRNGMLFTTKGIINIRNEKWKYDLGPLDDGLQNGVSDFYSRAYLRHLVVSREMLGAQIASLHNLAFYLWLMREARRHIVEGDFHTWKTTALRAVSARL